MRKLPFILVIVVLLASVVGYLALDRNEKNSQQQHQKTFDTSFAK